MGFGANPSTFIKSETLNPQQLEMELLIKCADISNVLPKPSTKIPE